MSANKPSILITGVSSGIGLATAKYLLDKGYRVFGSVRKPQDAKRLEEELGVDFFPLLFDVCDAQAIEEALPKVRAQIGEEGLRGLINNAGIAISGPLQHIDIDEFKHQFEVNVFGVLKVTQAFLPLLGASKNAKTSPGKIINISSVSGLITLPFLGPYCSSKYALESISDALRRELLIYGIDVVVLEPGPIQSAIWQKAREEKNSYSHTDYGPLLAQKDKLIASSEKRAIPAEVIARRIYKTLSRRNSKTRYMILKNKLGTWLTTKMPDRLIDRFVKKGMLRVLNKANN